jgi:hypothetical protein
MSSAPTHTGNVASALAPAVLAAVNEVPRPRVRKRRDPAEASRQLAAAAALKAAVAAGTLAWPGTVLGWVSLLPQLRSVWRIQVQLVVDIAAVHGHRGRPTQEELLHCLFEHAPARTLRRAEASGRGTARESLPARVLHLVVQRLALRMAQRLFGRRLFRLLPVVGAAGVGAYAYLETARVGTSAVALFQPKE